MKKSYLQGREPGAPVDKECDMDMSLTHKLDINFPNQHYGKKHYAFFPL